jgi:hypothetical protein
MTIARYNTTSGLAGCYMPDNVGGPLEFTRRKDLAAHIRYELEFLEWPAGLIREVKLNRLWAFIKKHGSSTAHFAIHYKQFVLEFHGLTEDEFKQHEAAHEAA